MRNDSMSVMGRRRRRQRQKTRFWPRIRTLVVFALAAAIMTVVGFFVSFSYTYAEAAKSLPELDDYKSAELAQTSVVYDANGNVVDELYGVQNRFVVSGDEIDPTLKDAVVAIEDHRFYQHRGLDFEAIGRAAQVNIQTLSIQEGGSTLTQQLIKNTYIAQNQRSIPSFQRKITEGSLAWQYEKEHSKQEILEQYLNTVYFGANAYGAEAAAKTYFNKNAEDLTLPESAMIAGIINLPGVYDPFTDPESARARRDVVLGKMLQYGYIDKQEYKEAVSQDLDLSRGRIQYENNNEYFLNAVRKELAEQYGDDAVYEGGLKIYTTLDPKLQEMASTAVDQIVDPPAGDPSASLVSVDPTTGAVKALVGGSDFEQVKFNLATQAQRQPGSSFKAFVLAEAIKQGISPDKTMYKSKDLKIPLPPESDEPYYNVENYGSKERGPITIKEATEQSDNTVFVQLALDLGMEKVVDMAHDLGIDSELDPFPATAIGGLRVGVTPLEMASAYSTFANHGVHMEPYLIQKVTTTEKDGGQSTLEEHNLVGQRALSEDEAAATTEMLRGVVTEGTASYFHGLDAEIGRPSAGKTGTTENFRDAWYVGFIPQLSTSVWVGYPDEEKPMVNINGLEQVNGENYPLDIWSAYMQQAIQEYPVAENFDIPSSDLDLKKKTDGRAYVPPPPETTQEESTGFDDFSLPERTSPGGITVPERTAPDEITTPDFTSPRTPSPRTAPPETTAAIFGEPNTAAPQPRRVRPAPRPGPRARPVPRRQRPAPRNNNGGFFGNGGDVFGN